MPDLSESKKPTPNQERALSLDKHISLTANAGSGKTAVLVDRYLKIAIEQKIDLSKIVAITFTEKAASELYAKISKEIEKLAENEVIDGKKQEFYNLRRKLFTAKISTIHSFCMDILREYSVEADIDANFSVADTMFCNELIDLSIEEVKKKYHSEDKEIIKNLVRFFGNWETLKAILVEMLNKREAVLTLIDTVYNQEEAEIEKHFNQKSFELRSEIIDIYKKDFIEVLRKINGAEKKVLLPGAKKGKKIAGENECGISRYIDEALISQTDKWLESQQSNDDFIRVACDVCGKILTQSGTIRKDYLKEFVEGTAKSIEDEPLIAGYWNIFSKLNYKEEDLALHKGLAVIGKEIIGVFREFLNAYERRKKEKGLLDFEDFLLKVYKITRIPEVCEQLKEKFSYIMIDEYQDTNEIQYKIFLPIVNNLLDNNLFVVGDEKQSIYRFRDAELEVFRRTKEEIEKVMGRDAIQQLPESFRMAPPLAFFTNTLFEALFSKPLNIFNEVENTAIIAAKQKELDGEVELIVIWDETKGKKSEEANAEVVSSGRDDNTGVKKELPDPGIRQIQLVAKKIKQLTEKKRIDSETGEEKNEAEWKDIAILCRKRKSFINIEKIFSEEGIPYTIIGGQGFYQRQMIYDISNYISFLVNNRDDAALTGILRSPFFMLSDTEIYDISLIRKEDKLLQTGNMTGRGTFVPSYLSLWEKMILFRDSLTEQEVSLKAKLTKVIDTISENIRIANSIDIIYLIRKIVEEGNYLTIIAGRKQGKTEIKNLEKLIRKTREFIKKGFKTLYDFKVFLSESISKEMEESVATVSEEANSVNVLTIHKAKGLQYKAVFIVDMQDVARSSTTKKKEIKIERNIGIMTKLPDGLDYFEDYKEPPIQRIYDYVDERKNIAEAKRLFYVAVTRAENYLYLSGIMKKEESSVLKGKVRAGSFFEFLLQGLRDRKGLTLIETEKELKLIGNLKRAVRTEDGYSTIEEEVSLVIPINQEMRSSAGQDAEQIEVSADSIPIMDGIESSMGNTEVGQEEKKYNINTEEIETKPSEEIYSATKISSFLQCPLKYHLTYNLGFSQFVNMKKVNPDYALEGGDNEYNFNDEEERKKYSDEDAERITRTVSALKGKVIHSILENEIAAEDLFSYIDKRIKIETEFYLYDKLPIEELRNGIEKEITTLYNSNVFEFFRNNKNYKNEYKVMVYDNDYILFGILDKVVFGENHITIIDYKTDNIDPNDSRIIKEKGIEYLNQLKFYAYLIYRKYLKKEVEIKIVFVKYPEIEIREILGKEEITEFGEIIKEAINLIRNNKFEKRLGHCRKCIYSDNKNSCIID